MLHSTATSPQSGECVVRRKEMMMGQSILGSGDCWFCKVNGDGEHWHRSSPCKEAHCHSSRVMGEPAAFSIPTEASGELLSHWADPWDKSADFVSHRDEKQPVCRRGQAMSSAGAERPCCSLFYLKWKATSRGSKLLLLSQLNRPTMQQELDGALVTIVASLLSASTDISIVNMSCTNLTHVQSLFT